MFDSWFPGLLIALVIYKQDPNPNLHVTGTWGWGVCSRAAPIWSQNPFLCGTWWQLHRVGPGQRREDPLIFQHGESPDSATSLRLLLSLTLTCRLFHLILPSFTVKLCPYPDTLRYLMQWISKKTLHSLAVFSLDCMETCLSFEILF